MDIVASFVLLILLGPLMLSIAFWIWLVSGRPILFRQERLGYQGNLFSICKFRTLRAANVAESAHREYVAGLCSGDHRLSKPNLACEAIPGGHFLRRTSLDELPQLWNILRGEMSLIGPRPDVLDWDDYRDWQVRRFEVVPGVTGLWQVSGKNKLTFNEMIAKDLQYVENRSLGLDLKILWKTAWLLARLGNE